MQAIIVDDEPKAIALLQKYLTHFPEIEMSGSFRNGLKALLYLNTHKVDIVFLDINMPHTSGLAIAKMIDQGTNIIFTTAHAEYAVESYEIAAVDYLLKPITLERFTRAIQKVLKQELKTLMKDHPTPTYHILVKSGSKIHKVLLADLYYLEKDHNYITYYLNDSKILARQSIAQALASLPPHFLQIHKSFIVNLEKIDFFDKHEVSVNGQLLSLGASFREAFFRKVSS